MPTQEELIAQNNEEAAKLGYGPSKGSKKNMGDKNTGVVEGGVAPQQCIIKAQSAPDTLRYQHRIEYDGVTFFARDLTPERLAKTKKAGKGFMAEGRDIQQQQQQLQRKDDKLGLEIERLSAEFKALDTTPEREAEIEASIAEIQAQQAELLEKINAMVDTRQAFLDEQYDLMSVIVDEAVVGAQWVENGEHRFSREVEFESRKAKGEVGEVILGRSMLTGSARDNLNGQ